MKKKHLLFTTLALALGSLTGGSEAMAQAGWESAFSQSQTTSTTWEALSTGSTTGKTLGESGTTKYYYLQESLTFTNTNAGGSGLTIKGTVYLYIPYGLTITCVGADGSGATGAGAGIELAEGNTLYIIGSGDGVNTTVTAKGGKAANGSNGGNGGNADFVYDSWMTSGTGGKGGDGGGGAGAGIGTRGGNGGIGGNGGEGYYHTTDWKTHDGRNGNNGTNGNTAENMGELYVDQTFGITVSATAGAGATVEGNGGKWGQSALDDDAGNNYSIAGGGGGGGGGFGGAAANIGTGGPGGGGGGGGAGGSIEWADTGFYTVRAYAGSGGYNADGSQAWDGEMAFVSWASLCAAGMVKTNGSWSESAEKSSHGDQTDGTGGSGAGCGNASSAGSMNAGQLKFNITYQPIKTRVNGSNTNSVTVQYAPSSATSVILPKNVEGYQWVLSVFGKDCSSNAQITKSVFTQAKKTTYGGNEEDDADRTIMLADVYGNLTFVEVASLCKLNNNNTNDQTIAEFCKDYNEDALNYPITVRLKDRTLYKDNHWNTICLPFDLTPAQFASSPLKGAQVKKLDEVSGYYPEGGTIGSKAYTGPTLYFNFTTVETSTETLHAGYPYLVKWASGDDLVDNTTKGKKSAVHQLDFTGVEISSTAPTFWEGNGAHEGAIQFVGTYSPTALTGGDKTKLVLGNDNKLYYPKKNMSVNSCRGYFIISGAAANAQQFVMSFDDGGETTSIKTVNVTPGNQDDAPVYNLNGQRLSAPQKGINIVNGKKVIIK